MADDSLAIVIEGHARTGPAGRRTLTPREPSREPNGTLWFGAELDDHRVRVELGAGRAVPGLSVAPALGPGPTGTRWG